MKSELAVLTRDWSYPSIELRSSLENPETTLSYPAEWLLDIFNGGATDSGIRVSELTAFQVTTFLACVDLIAGKISSLPFHVYERSLSSNGRAIHRVAYEHGYYDLLAIEPNAEMSRQTLLKAYLCHCLAWGNGYIEVQRDAGNNAIALWPRNPARTHPRRLTAPLHLEPQIWRPFPVNLAAGSMVYVTTDGMDDMDHGDIIGNASGVERAIPQEDTLHVPGLSFDGRIGMSTVWLARQTLGLALATEKFGAKYFANFARPGGLLKLPTNMKQEDRDKAKQSWMEAQGGENSNRIAVVPPGFEWQAMANNPQEAQATETRSYIRTEIASLFHVPTRMVGDTSRGSKSSTEQENQELLDYTLSPWISAIQLEWKRKLFGNTGVGRTPKNRFFVQFDTTVMLRGDAASREKFNASGKQWGYLNTNDIHALEGLNPIEEPWAEEYWMPVNMTLSTTPIDPGHQDGAGNGVTPKSGAAGDSRNFTLNEAYLRVFRDALGRLLAREKRNSEAFTQCFGAVLMAIRDAAQYDAERVLSIADAPTTESERFVADYIGGLVKRAAGWTVEMADTIVAEELGRAVRAIRISVYRECATAKAKETV
jgi:HK97 family phage portal protein